MRSKKLVKHFLCTPGNHRLRLYPSCKEGEYVTIIRMKPIILLAAVALCSAVPDAPLCTNGPEIGIENNSISPDCKGIFGNWLKSHLDLTDSQLKAVATTKAGSQFLIQVSPEVCLVTPISNNPRGPPALGDLCKLEGPCPSPASYKQC